MLVFPGVNSKFRNESRGQTDNSVQYIYIFVENVDFPVHARKRKRSKAIKISLDKLRNKLQNKTFFAKVNINIF